MSGESSATRPPPDLGVREAFERYLDRRRSESTEATMATYYYRLKLFVEWCEREEIESVRELSGWTFEQYETHRSGQDLAPITMRGEMRTLKNFVDYLERIEAVEAGLADRVHVPNVSSHDESDETQLLPADALSLIRHFRDTSAFYGTRRHVLLELLWFTSARLGGIRGLDLRDYSSDEQFVEFVHRPESGTPLKNAVDGQRPVALPADTCDVLDRYIEYHRVDASDEYDRQPLLSTRIGRMARATVRSDCYMASFPCHHRECPHGKDPRTCEYKHRDKASRCPSSRSPHQVRTGSIRWQRDLLVPPEVVSERANASLSVIKKHYDKTTQRERMETRRRQFVDQLGLELGDGDHDQESEP